MKKGDRKYLNKFAFFYKMFTEKRIKIILFVIGLVFIVCLGIIWKEIYGRIESIQFLTLMGLLCSSIICLAFSFKIKNKIEILSKKEVVKIYCSLSIQVLIGFIGVVAIILSILYGAYMNASTGVLERIKLPEQIRIWSAFSVYFIAITVVLFIRPLIKRLDSFR